MVMLHYSRVINLGVISIVTSVPNFALLEKSQQALMWPRKTKTQWSVSQSKKLNSAALPKGVPFIPVDLFHFREPIQKLTSCIINYNWLWHHNVGLSIFNTHQRRVCHVLRTGGIEFVFIQSISWNACTSWRHAPNLSDFLASFEGDDKSLFVNNVPMLCHRYGF